VQVRAPSDLRGRRKLAAALESFAVSTRDRVAIDVGAAAGGFTTALLDAGAARVYAIDAGYGQLRGNLRADSRVVNLERTNVAQLSPAVVPEPIHVVVIDCGYLALAEAVPQLAPLLFAPDAELVALVKPMFELGLGAPPADVATIAHAVAHARAGIERAGWQVVAECPSPVRGGRGAIEHFVHAVRPRRGLRA
jgi:23S rRNA (cytidine1920-2'-O)/16S rRNA (cytidine1409-2'-O)-methyltransferase